MQTQPSTPTIIINGIQIHAKLNTSAATGLLIELVSKCPLAGNHQSQQCSRAT